MEQYHTSKEWKRYLQVVDNRPGLFEDGELQIILDDKTVDDYVLENNRKLGVLYESEYHFLMVDLVKDSTGKMFPYERLVPAVKTPAVVAVPKINDNYVLIRQYRHAIREYQIAFPRGFAETGLDAKENVKKELGEELGITEVTDLQFVGKVTPDSGAIANRVEVYSCQVNEPVLKKGYEGIKEILILSKAELISLIKKGIISDSYTLSAVSILFLDE